MIKKYKGDVERINIAVGLVVLLALVIGLIITVIIVNIKNNTYNELVKEHQEQIVIEPLDNSANIDELNEAIKVAEKITVDVNPTEIETNNKDENGNCIAFSLDEGTCDDTIKLNATLVTIDNIPDGFSIDITNSNNSGKISISPDSNGKMKVSLLGTTDETYEELANGKYVFKAGSILKVTKYTMSVYYLGEDNDKTLIIRNNFETPEKNYLYDLSVCKDKLDNPNCAEYLYSDDDIAGGNYTLKDIVESIKASEETEKENKTTSTAAMVIVFILVIVVLVVALLVAFIAIKRISRGGVLHENEVDETYDEDASKTYEEFEKNKDEIEEQALKNVELPKESKKNKNNTNKKEKETKVKNDDEIELPKKNNSKVKK